jgi:glycine oxidase
MQTQCITVVGAGITGLWQALTLARRGHRVRLLEQSPEPFRQAASAYAGAMLAPYCEAEATEPVVRELGVRALALWRAYPGVVARGTLVVAQPRDRAELVRFARMTDGHRRLAAEQIDALEPACGGRFASALYFPEEAHMEPAAAMAFLLAEATAEGVATSFGTSWAPKRASAHGEEDVPVIDCRGLAAQPELASLRGVRGERLIVRSHEVVLTRPMRLLHPRHPLYLVPWGDGRYMLGATVIESEDRGGITVRSALELLGSAYALHPALAEAEILDAGASLRPAFPDNVPKVIVRGRRIFVNGVYRHGFLLAPVLAELVADYLEHGAVDARILSIDNADV